MEVSRLTLPCALLSLIVIGCKPSTEGPPDAQQNQEFHAYWHAGKAEVNSYALNQSRYGEVRKGKAVLIFVTEDLSKKQHVKIEDPSQRNKVNVLKLNFIKNFVTGIYPYSMMLSVFTPTNSEKDPASVKVAMSSQEWCGQVYTQLNLRGNRYAIKSHSYFEQEADRQFSVRQALLEDEIWNLIRLDRDKLPVGEVDMIPGLFYTALNHVDLKVKKAIAEKTVIKGDYVYTLRFPEEQRTLSIRYAVSFPFKILGWKETWTEAEDTLETTATLDKTLFIDYWTKNKNEFLYLRDSLNLPLSY